MIAPTLIGISSIFLSLPRGLFKSNFTRSMIVFVPIFLFLALRYNYGNDYSAYFELFENISSLDDMDYGNWHAEIGWLILNRLFSDIGFFPMIVVLAFFNCYVFARFLTRFVPSQYYWLAISLYVFNPENMLVLASAMRQSVSIALFLLALEYILNKNFIKYLLCILLAGTFHASSLVLIPVYFLCSSTILIRRELVSVIVVFYISLFFVADNLIPVISDFLGFVGWLVFERYLSDYEDKGVVGSGLGLVFYGVNLAVLLFFHNAQNDEGRLIYKLAILGIFIIPFGGAVMMISRLAFYFKVVMLAAVPLVAIDIKNIGFRLVFILTHLVFVLFMFYGFFQSPVWKDSFSEYTTIFSAVW